MTHDGENKLRIANLSLCTVEGVSKWMGIKGTIHRIKEEWANLRSMAILWGSCFLGCSDEMNERGESKLYSFRTRNQILFFREQEMECRTCNSSALRRFATDLGSAAKLIAESCFLHVLLGLS
ncbi:uncharacterized protein A4U43_UnF5660 [Asparagus officinalis]|uniref:Uncharacterized protein n=1 Tax=Asparagus officinalis TaxID=4686 RepID=A0A1R3L6M8_ASPOF|nr:uncharacterized protein A4U43_UnF5660 [Asparagus officinalis]